MPTATDRLATIRLVPSARAYLEALIAGGFAIERIYGVEVDFPAVWLRAGMIRLVVGPDDGCHTTLHAFVWPQGYKAEILRGSADFSNCPPAVVLAAAAAWAQVL